VNSFGPIRFLLGATLLLSVFQAEGTPPAEALPDASAVMQKLVQRAEKTDRKGEARKYSYQKRLIKEELDGSGKTTKTAEELFTVTPIEGVPFPRLIEIQHRELTQEEVEAQDRKERQFRQKLAEHRRGAPALSEDDALNPKLIERYDFKVERRDLLKGRSVLVLSFQPAAKHFAGNSMEDKVLNQLAGTLWVDEADSEVAKLRVGLTGDLWLGWFGMAGSLKQCDIDIERQRLPNGVWVNKSQIVILGGRKILSPMRYRTIEDFFNFVSR
jgi:hypothetical protein